MKKFVATASLVGLLLVGCSSGPSATTPPDPAKTTDAVDVTAKVKAAAGPNAKLVLEATIDETDAVVVSTSITDPRGKNGSPEAKQAIAICNAAVKALSPRAIRVQESDGTTFVIYMPTKTLDIPANTCGEY